jgi:hypothetical protein
MKSHKKALSFPYIFKGNAERLYLRIVMHQPFPTNYYQIQLEGYFANNNSASSAGCCNSWV